MRAKRPPSLPDEFFTCPDGRLLPKAAREQLQREYEAGYSRYVRSGRAAVVAGAVVLLTARLKLGRG